MANLRIDNTKPIQHDFWGNGAIYHGYAGMNDCDGRVYTEEQCELEAKRAGDLKVKIARTRYEWWAWDEEKQEWDWNNEKMQSLYRWIARMKKYNITVALNTGWCSPGDINSSSWGGKSPFNVEGDWEKSKQNYANWVSETVHQMVEVRGFTNVKILVLFTEPQNVAGVVPEGFDVYSVWLDAAKAAHDALVRDGRRNLVKLMGPNEGSTFTSDMLNWVGKRADFIDIFSSHAYNNTATIDKEYLKSGKTVFSTRVPGGRIFKTVELQPNTDYEFSMDALVPELDTSLIGDIKFGLFDADTVNIITDDGKPALPATAGSLGSITINDISTEYRCFTVKFNSKNTKTAQLGVFYDLKKAPGSPAVTKGMYIDNFQLTNLSNGKNVLENGDFSDMFKGWKINSGGGSVDPYYNWYEWSSTGIQYVPERNGSRPYCFDEYNVGFHETLADPQHGSDIVTAAVAFMNVGAKCSLMWTLFDQLWPNSHSDGRDRFVDGEHRWGVMPTFFQSLVPHRSYYAFGLLSRYVDGEGTKVFRGFGEDNVHTTMSVSKDGYTTVVVVNNSKRSVDFNVKFENALNLKMNRHFFDPEKVIPDEKAELIGIDKTVTVVNSLSDTIAPYGVIVYTTHND